MVTGNVESEKTELSDLILPGYAVYSTSYYM